MTVRTRFAPSPTGYLHVGGARTALFSWLYARKHGGKFILRIEDTDLERSTPESVNAILEGMTWLGLEYDEGPFYQTQRFDRYKALIQQLLDQGDAYYCYCSKEELEAMREEQMANKVKPRYDGRCRHREAPLEGVQPVIRFKNPTEGEVVVDDLVRGRVVFQNSELDDLIIARGDGSPTYNFTVVVDDTEMGVNYVIRGDDHLNNTPRQINIMRALGYEPPKYAHVPMILGDDGKRLSKRHGAVGVMQYRDEGYLPEALLNYLVRLGWSHGDQEVFSIDEMIELFDVKDINNSASAFNTSKLVWLNQHYLKESDAAHIAHHLSYHLGKLDIDPSQGPDILDVIDANRDRAKTLVELAEECRIFYSELEGYDEALAEKHLSAELLDPFRKLQGRLEALEGWEATAINGAIKETAAEFDLKLGKIMLPLRVAVTGSTSSPSIDLTVKLLGKEKTLLRMDLALDYIAKQG